MRIQNLLVIDDDPEDIELFTLALSQVDPTVMSTALNNAAEALKLLDSNVISPDAIFVDVNMPVMSGEEFLEAKQQKPHLADIPTFVFTTTSDEMILKKTIKKGASAAFTKPTSFKELKTLLSSLIQ